MRFIAENMREYMARLGVRTVDELVGRTDLLKRKNVPADSPASRLDLGKILDVPVNAVHHIPERNFNFGLENTKDEKILIPQFADAIEKGEKALIKVNVTNLDRTFGTLLGSYITNKGNPVPDDTYTVTAKGAGGQSFGAFIPKGLTITLEGDSNDYFGKGLSGGTLAVFPPKNSPLKAEENIIIGNVALFGATSGKAFINGIAGERFCVRNSGAAAVVEGTGDHGCEYMTGGTVVILGTVGKNFAAGMSGGTAYVLDPQNDIYTKLNRSLVGYYHVTEDEDIRTLRGLIEDHVNFTDSARGKEILDNFEEYLPKFKKIIPHDYKKVTELTKQYISEGMSEEQAQIAAFEQMRG